MQRHCWAGTRWRSIEIIFIVRVGRSGVVARGVHLADVIVAASRGVGEYRVGLVDSRKAGVCIARLVLVGMEAQRELAERALNLLLSSIAVYAKERVVVVRPLSIGR